jgi:membrane protein DedA with SNARE-associated domain
VWNALLVWAGWHLGRGFSQLEVYTGPVALASMVAFALWYGWRVVFWKPRDQ